ncbi:DJ-1/PfpI family protein [Neiella marina]|uniref:DJ-1/PfpI family protein n=1 Tax=Neiella holothuriorum TaxID=2870530 RepID=A0ABS7EHG9_9GAMM|nr:DJ-1 family glyoxalase III [Neiella holothuriorum]MBW8191799.1 DJ-1/PfpI family protein [Neiella holothuriorum]
MTAHVLLPVASGSEDMEVVIIADVLRRAGITVTLASISDSRQLTLARHIQISADALLSDVASSDYDMIVLPGGMPGSEALRDCQPLIERLQQQRDQDGWIAAICAAPAVVLQHHDLLGEAYATCYPTFQDQLYPEYCLPDEAVVVDEPHKVITSQAPGTAMRFALTLIDVLLGEQASIDVETPLCMLLEELEDEELEHDDHAHTDDCCSSDNHSCKSGDSCCSH